MSGEEVLSVLHEVPQQSEPKAAQLIDGSWSPDQAPAISLIKEYVLF